jgi:hypothetical protein
VYSRAAATLAKCSRHQVVFMSDEALRKWTINTEAVFVGVHGEDICNV